MAEKKIGARTFKVDAPLATTAIVMQARLIKAIGPGIAQLPAIFAGAGSNVTLEAKAKGNEAAMAAITSVLGNMEPEAVARLLKDLAEMAMIRRQSGQYDPVDFDGDFSQSLADVIPVVTFVVREVFGDFFSGVLANGRPGTTARA